MSLGFWIAVAIAVMVGIGIATDNVPSIIGVGIVIGIALFLAIRESSKDESQRDDEPGRGA